MSISKFRERRIFQRVQFERWRINLRKKRCSDFKASVKQSSRTVRRFCRLTGAPLRTVYVWTSSSDQCIPPPIIAVRFAWVLANFPEVADALEKQFPPVDVIADIT